MKLNWRVNECHVLVAEAKDVIYYVGPAAVGLWKPSKRVVAFDGKVEIEGAVDGMSLTNAIAWCEKDVERPADASGPAPKFPSTLDAKEWGIGAAKDTGCDWTRAGILKEWFQAALSHGFREGQASVYELVDKAQRSEAAFGPEWAPVTDPLLAESLFPHVKWDPAPPGDEAPKPQSVDEQLVEIEERFVGLESRVMGNSAELSMWGRRIEKLEAKLPSVEEQFALLEARARNWRQRSCE